jgi:hypothetical protein
LIGSTCACGATYGSFAVGFGYTVEATRARLDFFGVND